MKWHNFFIVPGTVNQEELAPILHWRLDQKHPMFLSTNEYSIDAQQ